jgi:hypothetical protein
MSIYSGSLTIAYRTTAPNDNYTVGYADNLKERIANSLGLAYWDIYTNSSKTSSGQLIAHVVWPAIVVRPKLGIQTCFLALSQYFECSHIALW